MSDVPMIPVISSSVTAIGRDDERGVLVVEFRGGARYEYDDVSREEMDEGLAADSVGGWLARKIKSVKDCRRVS